MNHIFAVDGDDDSIRPRRSRQACSPCRKRKQRCLRDDKDSGSCLNCRKRQLQCRARLLHSRPLAEPREESAQGEQIDTESASKSLQTSRFTGHLNPETHLLVQAEPGSPTLSQEDDHLGIWFRNKPATSHVVAPLAVQSLQRLVNVLRDSNLPDREACDVLIDIYFSTIHQFIPLIDEASFREDRASGTLAEPLLCAVLLTACRDARARPYLRLSCPSSHSSDVLQPREFAQKIYVQITSLLKAEVERDKVTLIQVHALLSLHCEGPDGNETASLNLITAIHFCQVLGMHLPRAEETDKTGRSATIFWSLWSLDRLNAGYNGRPTIIHERDMAHKAKFSCGNDEERNRFRTFLVWLRLTELLDETISYYRPSADQHSTGWDIGFPSFEEIIAHIKVDKVAVELLYVLEIYYNAVAILTARFRAWNPINASNPATTRQALSTLRVLQIADEVNLTQLPALPLITYTMTLCLSVTYRQTRELVFTPTANRARKHLATTSMMLEELSVQWWTAEAMANLGRRAMRKVGQMQHASGLEVVTEQCFPDRPDSKPINPYRPNAVDKLTSTGNDHVSIESAPSRPNFGDNSKAAADWKSFRYGSSRLKRKIPSHHENDTSNPRAHVQWRPTNPDSEMYLPPQPESCQKARQLNDESNDTTAKARVDSLHRHENPSFSQSGPSSPVNDTGRAGDSIPTRRRNSPETSYDFFLLDSIPNLTYPEMGMANDLFEDITLFDGIDGQL